MSPLDDFQKNTSAALNDPARQSPDTVAGRDENGVSRRFNIYRNNRAGSLIEALQGTYPVLHKLLGDAFFKAAARAFIDHSPPGNPVLSEYGEGFGEFVQGLPGTSAYPYLADVATLEWCRLQAYHAADAPVLTMESLHSLGPANLLQSSLIRHSSAAFIESKWAIGSVWSQSQTGDDAPIDVMQAQSVLITRPGLDVQLQLLDRDGALFFHNLCQGMTIEAAAGSCLAANPGFDTGVHLQGLLAMGAFTSVFYQ